MNLILKYNKRKFPAILVKNSTRSRLGAVAAFLAIGLLLAASSARADLFYFTSDHCTGNCGPQIPGFGSVKLTQDGSDVDVIVTLFHGNKFVDTGAGMPFLFDDAGISLTDIINISSNSSKPLVAAVREEWLTAPGPGCGGSLVLRCNRWVQQCGVLEAR